MCNHAFILGNVDDRGYMQRKITAVLNLLPLFPPFYFYRRFIFTGERRRYKRTDFVGRCRNKWRVIPPIGTRGARCPPSETKGSRTQSTTDHKNGNDGISPYLYNWGHRQHRWYIPLLFAPTSLDDVLPRRPTQMAKDGEDGIDDVSPVGSFILRTPCRFAYDARYYLLRKQK